ncbi:NAD-dependent epimerase/dehydratase family protein [Nocardioides jishulii]|uniref:NAD-dependent epimerase/dehydratase family protein n=1 Tax=Nocardioides jishulii TaxID=2575440 RepID=A0A4U2YRU5_9ACTN|nr:NAD-dependent epimerase/dehydratase family protein [Nocardioides jishulii]QCX26365.1 NAD-dependent epimerase/dehydratase family protein [Nocardioides jishulii]TKI63830.1 NAD-dependent epimerase/dehydratase family protein [Nocardioides jishulii]
MDVLVLGGTRFVGRALVADALARGWQVTALHRGVTGRLPEGVEPLTADRADPAAFAAAVEGRTWDAVVDTWAGAPRTATANAEALRGRVVRYGYVSSQSVYAWGEHVDESSPPVDADPGLGDEADYAEAKRGAELGILASFDDAVLARAGLILGPHEDIGRLPWWLDRIAAGGEVVAPGRPDRPLQYVDARDLAAYLLDAVSGDLAGPVDVASRSGHATTRTLLEACVAATGSDAVLRWVDEEQLAAAGVEPWVQLPGWVPESGEFEGFLESDTSRAAATGLHCRPVSDTVADTWAWMQGAPRPPQRPDRPVHGLPQEVEQRLLDR